MAPSDLAAGRAALIGRGETFRSVGRQVEAPVLERTDWRRWWIAFAGATALVGLFAASLAWLLYQGTGIWGNNIPVTWALDIVAYDWWIGIASGGLLVSALFLLLGAEWRSALNRITETAALLAAAAAGAYPIIHLGRPWFFYWNLPYPNNLLLWPQFRSPLVWDAVDIIGFLGVAICFWYTGLLPDLAALRDRLFERVRQRNGPNLDGPGMLRAQLYGIAALGWRGSAVHWHRWAQAYRAIALLGIVLVVVLQTGASVMFAGSLEPGWHDTLLPVSYLLGAVFSGVAAMAVLAVVLRAVFPLGALVTARHLEILALLLLGLGLANAYCYAQEYFHTALFGDAFEQAAMRRRLGGQHAWAWWTVFGAALVPVQLFWIPRLRRAPRVLLAVGLLVAAGMWADHYMVIVVTLQHDFLPSVAAPYAISLWGAATFAGSLGVFLALLLLFLRYLPAVSILESRRLARPDPVRHAAAPSSGLADGPEESPGEAPLWGVAAEFGTPEALAEALAALRERAPQARLDSFSPVPVPAAAESLRLPHHTVHPFAVGGAVLGGAIFLAMCLYATGYDYVFIIGNKPRFSWPSFVVPSLSFAMLCGTVAVFLAMLVANRLPRLNHPAFNIPGFPRATENRFFLVVEARDATFDPIRAETALATLPLPPLAIHRVPR